MRDDAGKDKRTKPASVNGAAQCLDDRCYPRTLIQWRDDFAACASGVRIGVIDTDVDLGHPTFRGQNITHKSFLSEGRSPSPNWHGTGVLALLAGRPDSGTPGLIDQARFFVASIFFAGNDGQPVTDTVSLLQALDWMKTSGVTVVNMSLAGMDDELIRRRIASLASHGLVFTAAAGNEGPVAEPSYPAAYPQVIAVTAISKQLRIFPFANQGAYVDLAAPGVDIWTAVPDSREGYRSGTSFAAPFATALLAIQRQGALRLPKEKLLDYVKTVTLGATVPNPTFGRGLPQAPAACPAPVATIAQQAPVSDFAAR
jgi:subtilisin family serine protease